MYKWDTIHRTDGSFVSKRLCNITHSYSVGSSLFCLEHTFLISIEIVVSISVHDCRRSIHTLFMFVLRLAVLNSTDFPISHSMGAFRSLIYLIRSGTYVLCTFSIQYYNVIYLACRRINYSPSIPRFSLFSPILRYEKKKSVAELLDMNMSSIYMNDSSFY